MYCLFIQSTLISFLLHHLVMSNISVLERCQAEDYGLRDLTGGLQSQAVDELRGFSCSTSNKKKWARKYVPPLLPISKNSNIKGFLYIFCPCQLLVLQFLAATSRSRSDVTKFVRSSVRPYPFFFFSVFEVCRAFGVS